MGDVTKFRLAARLVLHEGEPRHVDGMVFEYIGASRENAIGAVAEALYRLRQAGAMIDVDAVDILTTEPYIAPGSPE